MEIEEKEMLNESAMSVFNESAEFRGDMDSSFGSDVHSVSFQEVSAILRTKPDINMFYRTPCSGSSRFSRRTSTSFVRIPTTDHINRLPDNILLRIFYYLNKVDLVQTIKTCRRFSKIGKDHTLWEFMNMNNQTIDENCLHALLDRQVHVLRLMQTTIMPIPQFLSGYDFNNLQVCGLTHLDLGHVHFSERDTLRHLLSRCRSLQALSLEHCELIDDAICREISQNLGLRFLDLVYASRLTKVGMAGLLSNCRNLCELNLAWAQFEAGAVDIVCHLLPPSIRRLNIAGPKTQITDEKVAAICNSCPYLTELDLSDNPHVTDKSLEYLADLDILNSLTLSRCYGIEPISFISLDYLDVLNVSGCINPEGEEVLRQRLPSTNVNASHLCTIAMPTCGESVSSIWGKRTRDWY